MDNMLCPYCWGNRKALDGGICTVCHSAGVIEDKQLSEFFKLSEMLASQTAVRNCLSNYPSNEVIGNLTKLAKELLDPIRVHFGPLHIDSGYRAPLVNKAVGGAPSSAHLQGWAADINARQASVTRKNIVDWVKGEELQYDQLIFEGTWVHISLFGPSSMQRRETLAMFPNRAGVPTYLQYDPKDPRILT